MPLEPVTYRGCLGSLRLSSHDLDAETGEANNPHPTARNFVRWHRLIACGASKKAVIN